MSKKLISAAFITLFMQAGSLYAAHPLITDDAGTQGKGKAQLEFIGEYAREKRGGVTTDSIVAPALPVLSYGITDVADIVLGISYKHIRAGDTEHTTTINGISDASAEVKWRLWEKDGVSFALKPGMTLPTGNDEKGLGSGKTTYHLFFITSKEVKPWAFHLNLGYIRNDNRIDERKNLWHASIAGAVDVSKRLKAVANIGIEKDGDKTAKAEPGFVLGGLIYSISENLDFDIAIKKGFNNHGTDYSIPAGITWRF